jgi:GDP-4-dehydro-6-deoxy-D-mannose reductase
LLERVNFHQLDLLDIDKTGRLLRQIAPDYILHLASQSSVAESWKEPRQAFMNNTNIFLNIIETVRLYNIPTRILSVGSSEQYGIVEPRDLPLKERSKTRPANPYAVARLSQEQLALLYANVFKASICCTRSFNHIGPGQSARFVVSSIARQFAAIKYKEAPKFITIGNGAIIRDFIDIADVLTAYDALLEGGRSGEIYNVCAGQGWTILDIIKCLADLCGVSAEIREDRGLLRPLDNPMIVGSYALIEKRLGWRPRVDLQTSLKRMVDYWAGQITGDCFNGA